MANQDSSHGQDSSNEMMTLVRDSMHDFHESMRLREELSIRIAKRTTLIIRFSMLGMLVLGIAMFTLIFTLTSNMNDITKRMIQMSSDMQNMNTQFVLVVENMENMNASINDMRNAIQTMPKMAESVNKMGDGFPILISDLSRITEHTYAIQGNMGNMTKDMANMSRQFTQLNHSVGNMGYNVNQLARPMKVMPFP